jgi:hypothetical protein
LEGDGAGMADDAAPISNSFSYRLVNDQSDMASGSSIQRKKAWYRNKGSTVWIATPHPDPALYSSRKPAIAPLE